MCVIIIKPANVQHLDLTTLKKAMKANPDGFGIAYRNGENTRIYKTLSYDDFLYFFERAILTQSTSDPYIVHCRIATHGEVTLQNCHPFADRKRNVAFFHNGTLSINRTDLTKTDSETFFRHIYLPLYYRNQYQANTAADIIRNYSKFAFMYKDGSILKQGSFECINGIYYSNTFFNAPRPTPTPIYQRYNYYDSYDAKQKPYYWGDKYGKKTPIDLEDLTD